MTADYDYSEAQVRDRDRERFLSALYAPAAKRAHLFALYAFDLELAHVADSVREPLAGEIRLQWWYEAISGERPEEARANPVASALLDTVARHELPKRDLLHAIDARRTDLHGDPIPSTTTLVAQLDATTGVVFALASKVLAPSWDATAAASSAGRAVGITNILRNLGRDALRGRPGVPLDVLAAHGVHTASIFDGVDSTGLRLALSEMIDIGRSELARLREFEIPMAALPAFLPVVLTPHYYAYADRKNFRPFESDGWMSQLRSQYLIWRAARRGRV